MYLSKKSFNPQPQLDILHNSYEGIQLPLKDVCYVRCVAHGEQKESIFSPDHQARIEVVCLQSVRLEIGILEYQNPSFTSERIEVQKVSVKLLQLLFLFSLTYRLPGLQCCWRTSQREVAFFCDLGVKTILALLLSGLAVRLSGVFSDHLAYIDRVHSSL